MYDTVKMYYDFLDNPKAPSESVLFKNCKIGRNYRWRNGLLCKRQIKEYDSKPQ